MQSTFNNYAMRDGLVLGVLFSLNFILSVTHNEILNFVSYFILPSIIYFTFRFTDKYRESFETKTISFGNAYQYVIYTFLYSSIISAAIKYVYLKYVSSDLLTLFLYPLLMKSFEPMRKNLTDEQIKSITDMFIQPLSYSVQSILVNLIYGALLGLIIAGLVSRKKQVAQQ